MTLDQQISAARERLYDVGVSPGKVLDHERRVIEEHREAGSELRTLKRAVLAELERMAPPARRTA